MKKFTVQQMVLLGLLTAMEIVFSRLLSISTPVVRISFAFLPLAVAAVWYGPLWGAVCAMTADIVGSVLFPTGPYFPGFTVTAALTGAIYGLLLYQAPEKRWRATAAVLIVNVGLSLGLNTVWLSFLLGQSVFALLPVRAVKCLIMSPVQIWVVWLIQRRVSQPQILFRSL